MNKIENNHLVDNPDVSTKNLQNGIELTTVTVQNAQVCDVRFIFDTGFKDAKADKHHIPHVLEHLVMESTYKGTCLSERLMEYGAETNASTDFDCLTIYARTPTLFVIDCIENMIRACINITISDELVEREKQVVLRESADQHDGLTSQVWGHFYADTFKGYIPDGYEEHIESINNITAVDIDEFHKITFQSCGLKVLAVGGLTDTAKKTFEAQLQAFSKRNPYRDLQRIEFEKICRPVELPVNPSGALVMLDFSSTVEPYENVRLASAADSYIINRYFNGAQADGLKKLRDTGLLYGVDVDGGRYGDVVNSVFTATVEEARSREGLLALMDVLFGILVMEEDKRFELSKKNIKNSTPLIHETVSELASWYTPDLTSKRPLWHLTDEVQLSDSLTAKQVRQQIFNMLTKSKWQIGMAAQLTDDKLFEALQKLYSTCRSTTTPRDCYDAYKSWRSEAEALPEPQPVELGILQIAVALGALISAGLSSVDYLPARGSNNLTSMLELGGANIIWGSIVAFSLITLMYLEVKWHDQLYKTMLVVAAAVAGLGTYIYMLLALVSDVGTDNVPFFWNDVASIVHPLFFVGLCLSSLIYLLHLRLKHPMAAQIKSDDSNKPNSAPMDLS